MTKSKKSKVKDEFKFSFNIGGLVYEGKGATPLEALQAVIPPTKIMSKGVLTVSEGEKKKVLVFTPIRLRRVFYRSAQPLLIKYLSMSLK